MSENPAQLVTFPAWWILAGLGMQGVVVVVTMVIAYHKAVLWLGDRLTKFETTLAEHASRLSDTAERLNRQADKMDKYEAGVQNMVGQLQRLIGRSEVEWRQGGQDQDRRRPPEGSS